MNESRNPNVHAMRRPSEVVWFCALRPYCLLLSALWLLSIGATRCDAQEAPPAVVQVYWKQSRTVPVAGVSHVTVLHESVCRAQILPDQVQFVGLTRGETLAFVWSKDQRLTLLVRVVEEPPKPLPPSLRSGANEALERGYVGSSVQSITGSGIPAAYIMLHRVSWQQDINGNRLSVQGLGQDATMPGAPGFNLNTASVQYSTPRSTFSFLDSIVNVSGGFKGQVVPFSGLNNLLVRGADIDLKRGANEYEFFAGASLPAFFLNFTGTRDLLGFNFSRTQSPRVYLYSTTAVADVPFLKSGGGFERRTSAFQTLGVTSHLTKQWAVQSMVGASTMGAMVEGAMAYTGQSRSAFFSATRSAANFPLNQLQLLSAGRSSLTGGANAQLTSWLAAALFYQHTSTQSNALFTQQGSSDYINPNLNFVISPRNRFTFNHIYTRSSGALTLGGRSSGQRESFAFSSQINDWLGNSAQVDLGSLSDPFHLNSRSEFGIRDSLNMRIMSKHTLILGVSHDRANPSVESRLNREIGLLSPALKQLFLLNPVAFVQSSSLAPELRALLSNLQPSNTQITLGGQFLISNRLNLSPNVGYFHSAQDPRAKSDSHLLGYTMTYQLTPTLQLESSLSNIFLLDSVRQGIRRNTVFTVGFNKSVSGAPRWLLPSHGRRGAIRGRVFRDLNVNGQFNAGEPGLTGIRVELNNGQTALTDVQGRFEFVGLLPETYSVSLPLLQFKEPVRVTSSTEVRLDLQTRRTAEVDFGIVNFSRITGNVFNDYLLNGERQPDAPAMRQIRLILSGGASKLETMTDGAGEFEFDRLAPGDYQLTLDRSTIPPNFVGAAQAFAIHVNPTTTAVQDIPLTALRSISGRVFFRVRNGESGSSKLVQVADTTSRNHSTNGKNGLFLNGNNHNGKNGNHRNGNNHDNEGSAHISGAEAREIMQPLSEIRLAVDHNVVTTDAQGNFVLRNLPAGEFTLSVLPRLPVPDGIKLPSWKLQLTRDPVQVQGATVVISNPELLKYFVSAPAEPAQTGQR